MPVNFGGWQGIAGTGSLSYAKFAQIGATTIAVTQSEIYSTTDGLAWSLRHTASAGNGQAVATSGSLAVVAVGGEIVSSPDGIVWTVTDSNPGFVAVDLTWVASVSGFVACADTAFYLSSSGTNWYEVYATTTGEWSARGILSSAGTGLTVAVGTDSNNGQGLVFQTYNPNTQGGWSYSPFGLSAGFKDCVYSDALGVYVFIGVDVQTGAGAIYYAPSIDSLTQVFTSAFGLLGSVQWFPDIGLFVTGSLGGQVAYSQDGINWSYVGQASAQTVYISPNIITSSYSGLYYSSLTVSFDGDIVAKSYAVSAAATVETHVFHATLSAQGYAVGASAETVLKPATQVKALGYAVSATAYGGGTANGQGYAVGSAVLVNARDSANISAQGYAVSASVAVGEHGQTTIAGTGYAVSAQAYGGIGLAGQGYAVSVAVATLDYATTTLAAQGYAVSANAAVALHGAVSGNAKGYAVAAKVVGGGKITGQGYAVSAVIYRGGAVNDDLHSEATVLNAHTNETTRYLNYRFKHLLVIGGKLYGVKTTGLYGLGHGLDADYDAAGLRTGINGKIITKATDYGSFQSAHVPYVYLDHDLASPEKVKVTPVVDGIDRLPHTSRYGSRKVHLSRGVSGRYHQYIIENISHLQGAEWLVEKRQRRVK